MNIAVLGTLARTGKGLMYYMDFEGADESQTFSASGPWAGGVTITYAGDVRIDTSQYKVGTSCLECNLDHNSASRGDHVKIAGIPNFTLSDFTFEFWVRLNYQSNWRWVIMNGDVTWEKVPSFICHAAGGSEELGGTISQTTYRSADKDDVTTGVWYHMALSVKDGTARMFFNGTQLGDSVEAFSSGFAGATMDFYIGYGGPYYDNYPFSGWIDQLKIWDYAKYTANFTPE